MKIISIVKAVASGLVWGLGQLLNGQFLKALFFFVFFAGLVSTELLTSSYLEQTDAYDKLPGQDFGDDWVQNSFLADYNFNKFDIGKEYAPFEAFLVEIGGETELTEDLLIQFLAKDLIENNRAKYTNLLNNNDIIQDNLEEIEAIRLFTRQNLFRDNEGRYFVERNIKLLDGSNRKEYVETTMLTGILNEDNILLSVDGLELFNKTGLVFRSQNVHYLQTTINAQIHYINLLTEEILLPRDVSSPQPVTITGPLYRLNQLIYEYFQAGIVHQGARIQYRPTYFTDTVRQSLHYTYAQPWNRYDGNDFVRFLIKVYFEIDTNMKEDFIYYYNNFFYDQAGVFLRGYWSVATLGVAKKVNFNDYISLYDALRATSGQYVVAVNVLESIPLQGHVSTILLLEGLIFVILSLFFFIFMLWSILDAYRVAEAKRKKERVLKDVKYFKDVYEKSFEYIILSPAMFVLAFISIMPIAFGFVIAFTNISGNESMLDTFDWVGFKNFFALFNFSSGLGSSFGRAFWRVLGWTIIWAIFSTFTVFFGGFFQALILNSEKVVFRKFWRTVLILPWAIPALLSQMVFRVMFNELGFINTFMQNIGVYDILHNLNMLGVSFDQLTGIARFFYLGEDNIQWFSNPFNPTFVRVTLIVINIWLGFPYFMALMTGVMTAIDRTLYEAADIDGATNWQKIWSITMPLVLYSTAPILIMTFSGNFNNFGVIYFITNGGPNEGHYARGFAGDTDILISWMYKLTVNESIYNMASVFSVLIFIFVGSLTAWNLSRTRAFMED